MAAATIKVRDHIDENGHATLDMDVVFAPDIDNDSLAHRLVQQFIIFINTPPPAPAITQTGTKECEGVID